MVQYDRVVNRRMSLYDLDIKSYSKVTQEVKHSRSQIRIK